MKMSILAALLALAFCGSTAAAPANEPADPDGTIQLPLGYVLQGQVVDGAFQLAALAPGDASVVEPSPTMGGPGEKKACTNDIPGGGSYAWYPVSTALLTNRDATNTASAGECIEESHDGLITLMQFRTTGDYYGIIYIEGCNADGVCGYYQVWCNSVGTATGTPNHEGWGALMAGRDTTCQWQSYGSQPHEWNNWEGWVGNAHNSEGTVSAVFY